MTSKIFLASFSGQCITEKNICVLCEGSGHVNLFTSTKPCYNCGATGYLSGESYPYKVEEAMDGKELVLGVDFKFEQWQDDSRPDAKPAYFAVPVPVEGEKEINESVLLLDLSNLLHTLGNQNDVIIKAGSQWHKHLYAVYNLLSSLPAPVSSDVAQWLEKEGYTNIMTITPSGLSDIIYNYLNDTLAQSSRPVQNEDELWNEVAALTNGVDEISFHIYPHILETLKSKFNLTRK